MVEAELQWLAEKLGLDLKGCYNGNKSIANTVFNVHGCHAENLTSVPIRQYSKKNLNALDARVKALIEILRVAKGYEDDQDGTDQDSVIVPAGWGKYENLTELQKDSFAFLMFVKHRDIRCGEERCSCLLTSHIHPWSNICAHTQRNSLEKWQGHWHGECYEAKDLA